MGTHPIFESDFDCLTEEMKLKIAPSILGADLSNLASECEKLLEAGADWMHLDVMDGHFVPNLTFGQVMVSSLRKSLGAGVFLDCHLMISSPDKWVDDYAKAGASQFCFHLEAMDNNVERAVELVQRVGAAGMLAVMAKCAELTTPVSLALVMTVEPGFGGQKFMGDMLTKVKAIREKYAEVDIQVDGGVGLGNIGECWKAGANAIVSGSAIIKTPDWQTTIGEMRNKCA